MADDNGNGNGVPRGGYALVDWRLGHIEEQIKEYHREMGAAVAANGQRIADLELKYLSVDVYEARHSALRERTDDNERDIRELKGSITRGLWLLAGAVLTSVAGWVVTIAAH